MGSIKNTFWVWILQTCCVNLLAVQSIRVLPSAMRLFFKGGRVSNHSSSFAHIQLAFSFFQWGLVGLPFLCLLCTNYSIIEPQLAMKGFRFTFWADVLPSNAAVIVSLVHLSFSPSTVKRPAGAGRNVRRLPCLCRASPFNLNAPQHTHHSLNISSCEVFGNVMTRVAAVFPHVMCRRPASWKGSDRCLDRGERTLTLSVWGIASTRSTSLNAAAQGLDTDKPGPDLIQISTSGLDLTCSGKFPIPAKPELQRWI